MTITQSQIDALVEGQRAVLVSDIGDFPPHVGRIRILPDGKWIDVRTDGGDTRSITQHGEPFKANERSLFVEPPSIYANVDKAEPSINDIAYSASTETAVVYRGRSLWVVIRNGQGLAEPPPGALTLLVDGMTGKAVD